MPLNRRLLRTEIDKQSKIVFNKIKPKIQQRFELSKEELLEEFEEHPVTQEIAEGPTASSSFAKTKTGGNLFSLLGFENGENPTENLRKIIEDNIVLNIQRTTKKNTARGITWETPVTIPTQEEINELVAEENPLAWSPSRAWTTLIEKGIPWFAHYLFDDEREITGSRSDHAIQIKGTIKRGRGSSMPGIKYVSELISNFKKSLFS
jgi:hypothetical protein